MAANPDDVSADPAVVDVNVTQPWLSTKASRRRRFCHRSDDVRDQSGAATSFTLHDKQRHYIKKEKPRLCATHDPHISRRPSQFCRKNGFDRPLNALQILSWFFFIIIVVVGCVLIIPALSVPVGATFGVLFLLSAVGVFGVALAVTRSDPADPLIFEIPDPDRVNTELAREQMAICDLCGPTHIKSKHCRACNKCVGNFDHHCKWLNNCIGEGNYKLFLLLIVLVGILATLVLSFGVVVIIEEAVYHRVAMRFAVNMGGWNVIGYFIGLGLLMLLNLALLGLDLQLVALHVYLVKEGITTFEYITQRVQAPKHEAANANQPHKACCAEWIVIDRRRLKRARARLSTKAAVDSEKEEGNDQAVSQKAEEPAPSALIEIQPDTAEPSIGRLLFQSTSLSNNSEVRTDSEPDGILTLRQKEPKVVPLTYESVVSVQDALELGVIADRRPVAVRDYILRTSRSFDKAVEESAAPVVPDLTISVPMGLSSGASSVAGFEFEDEVEEDPPPERASLEERKVSSEDTTTGPSQASDRGGLQAHRLPAPSVAPVNFDCRIRYLNLQRAATHSPEAHTASVRRWARLLSNPTGGAPEKGGNQRGSSRKIPPPEEEDAYSTRAKVVPRRPLSNRDRREPRVPFRVEYPTSMPDPDVCVIATEPTELSPGPLAFTIDCFPTESRCRELLQRPNNSKQPDPSIVKVYPRARHS